MDRQQAIGNRCKATGKRQQAIALAISIAAWGTSSNKMHTNASRGQESNNTNTMTHIWAGAASARLHSTHPKCYVVVLVSCMQFSKTVFRTWLVSYYDYCRFSASHKTRRKCPLTILDVVNIFIFWGSDAQSIFICTEVRCLN